MSTSKSPLKKLKAEARRMAKVLKDTSEGKGPPKMQKAASVDPFKFGLVMDDKVITIEMHWAKVRETSEAGLVEFIVNHMRGENPVQH